MNENGEMFRIERLRHIIEMNWQNNAHQLLSKIYEALELYSRNTIRSDDITVVVLKVQSL